MSYTGKYALAKHETLALKCEDLELQLEEARKEKKRIMRWMKKYLNQPNGYKFIGYSDLYEMYEQLKEKGDE